MGLSRDDLVILMNAFDESAWTEMVLTVGGTRLELTSTGLPPTGERPPPSALARGREDGPGPAPPAPASAPPPPAVPQHAAAGLHEVLAPSVGMFYRAPAPGAPSFVEEGARVAPDDIVCIVEVMKLMNHVKAGVGGIVRSVHAENGEMIEHGQLLFTVEAGA